MPYSIACWSCLMMARHHFTGCIRRHAPLASARLGVSGQDTGCQVSILRAKKELLTYGLQRFCGLRRTAANPLSPCFRLKLVCYMSCFLPFRDPYLLDHARVTACLCYPMGRPSFLFVHFLGFRTCFGREYIRSRGTRRFLRQTVSCRFQVYTYLPIN